VTSPGTSRETSPSGSGFTRADYRRLLETALRSGYEFRSFDDRQPEHADARLCLLRHDIDVDMGAAVEMAELEAEVGIRSTYFLMLRSPTYNLLSRANHRLGRRLVELGHWLGLHYDEGFTPDPLVPLTEAVRRESRVLEENFGATVRAVSFHQPAEAVLRGEVRLEGMINTYDREGLGDFEYVSDSNMTWRSATAHQCFEEAIHPRLHLLIHPLWWVSERPGMSTGEAFDRALLANWTRAQKQMLETERAYGPERRFVIELP
jgi:hypothetical protein